MRFDIRITNGKQDRKTIAAILRGIATAFDDEESTIDPLQDSDGWCGWVCEENANADFDWEYEGRPQDIDPNTLHPAVEPFLPDGTTI
jgi:hypothetical protein